MNRRFFLKVLAFAAAGIFFRSGFRSVRAGAAASALDMRAIPSTGETIPAVGLGTWQTFDVPPGSPEASRLKEVLSLFHASGGRVVDSSPMYGRSEETTGELARALGISEDLFMATKVWTGGRENGIRQMENSIRLLGPVDLMQVHNLVDWEMHLETLRSWKAEGKIRYSGITHYRTDAFSGMEDILRRERPDFIQIPYSIEVRKAEERLLPMARDLGAAVLVNRPFEAGNLFRRVRDRVYPSGRFGCSGWAQFFLRFILSHEAVTCVIPATSNPAHLAENMKAGIPPFPGADERREMVRFFEKG